MYCKSSFSFKRIISAVLLISVLLSCGTVTALADDECEEILADVVDDTEAVPEIVTENAIVLSGEGETETYFTVEVTSDIRTGFESHFELRKEKIAFVSGGGVYQIGDTVTLTTTLVAGFTFLGWYRINEQYKDSPLYSYYDLIDLNNKNLSHMFTVDESSIKLKSSKFIALYQQTANTYTLDIHCPGLYTLDGMECWGGASYNLSAGEHTLTYTGSDVFLYWVNSSDKIVSRAEEYTFYLYGNKSLSAVCSPSAQPNSAFVVFKSAYDQVLASRLYSSDEEGFFEDIEYPFPPSKMGCIFIGWDKTEEEIKDAMKKEKYVEVKPMYRPDGRTYTITVKYNSESGETLSVIPANVGEDQQITAATKDGQTFYCWKNTAGEVLSYNRDYIVRSVNDITLIASYESASGKAAVGLTGVSKTSSGDKTKISFTLSYDVYDENDSITVEEVGFVRTTDSTAATAEELVVDGSKVSKTVSLLTADSGSFTMNAGAKTGIRLWVRGYVIYKDDSGLHTIYTNIVNETF